LSVISGWRPKGYGRGGPRPYVRPDHGPQTKDHSRLLTQL
jgi:hypothetical protein